MLRTIGRGFPLRRLSSRSEATRRRHSRCLQERCPSCWKSQYTLTRSRIQPGFCTQCASWLGSPPQPGTFPEIDIEVLSQQRWVLDAIEELYRFGVRDEVVPWERFSVGLAACIDAAGATKRLGRATAISHQVLRNWRNLKSMPSFKQLVKLCHSLDVSPLQFLLIEPDALKKEMSKRNVGRLQRPRQPTRPRIARDRILQAVKDALDERNAPIRLSEVAHQLGITVSALSYRFPQECILITARYRAHRTQLARQKLEQQCNEVRQVMHTLYERGIHPSYNNVKEAVSDPNMMRKPEVRAAWHAVRRE